MSARSELPDARDRLCAATVFDRNIVVEAGAGTGKTSLLVERVLVAIGSGRARLSQIAAVTFTEKAAGEMRERLGDGLETLRALAAGDDRRPLDRRDTEADRAFAWLRGPGGLDDETLRRRALEALHGLDRATVTTVHGFCAEILRAHPFDADVSPEFEIDRGERFAAAFPSAWEGFLGREFGADGARTALWSRVLGALDLGSVEGVARALSRSGVPLAVLADDAPWPDARALFGPEASALARRVSTLLAAVPGMRHKARAFLDAAESALRALADGGLDETLRARLAAEPIGGAAPGSNKTIPPERVAEFEALVAEVRGLLRPLADVDDARLRDVVAAAAPFAREFREALTAAGLVDFDALLALTRDVIRRSPSVRDAVSARYPMLLVDEFQDTDPIQYEIVLHLAARRGGSAVDPFDADLEPGRLFIVGDPKQSIYRFRGADYGAYRRAVARVVAQGGLRLALTANFRTVPSVLGAVNALFTSPSRATWTASDYQPDYRPIDPVRPEISNEPSVELWSVLPGGASAADRRDAEGRLVARRLREIRQAEGRPWKDFYVLLRAFSEVSRYVRPLRDAGIPFVVTGGRTFHERTEVVRLLSHLRLLAHPDDAPALLAWLRSPAGAVPDAELAAWAGAGGSWVRDARPDPARWPNLSRALEDLRALQNDVRDLPLDALVRRTLEHSLLAVAEAFAFEGAQRVANLRKLVVRACELARDGTMSLVQVVDALEERAGVEPEGESPLADEKTDAVRVLTIHASKGLEAPVVVVPDLARQDHHGGGEDVEVGVHRGPPGPTIALRTDRVRNAARIALDRDDRRHGEAEDVRVLYVALTRARDRLVVLAGRPRKTGAAPSWIESLAAWGYRQDAIPADGAPLVEGRVVHRILAETPPGETSSPRAVVGAPAAVTAYEQAVAALAERAERSPLRAPSGTAEELGRDADDGAVLARDAARAVGTAVHKLLERWRPGAPVSRAAIAAASRAAADERRCDPSMVERDVVAIAEGFETSRFAAVMAGADRVLREVAVLRRDDEGYVWRGRADVVYRRADGSWVVADFKTDASADGAAARYAPQLRGYAEAVCGALRLAALPRAELWMLRLGTIVEVPL